LLGNKSIKSGVFIRKNDVVVVQVVRVKSKRVVLVDENIVLISNLSLDG